jgi:predicted  nucleic acid-binding Zn-ribbon protein
MTETIRLYIALALAVVVFSGGAWAGWAWQHRATVAVQAGWDADKLAWENARREAAEALAAAVQAAREQEQQWQEAAAKAERKNAELKNQITAASRAAAAAARGLRDDGNAIAVTLDRVPTGTAATAVRIVSAATQLLGACADEYRRVAAEADQLAIERQTLIDAWPVP